MRSRFFVLVLLMFCSVGFAKTSSKTDLLSRARSLYEKGNYKEAIKSFEAIPRDSGNYLMSREELGWAYFMAGDYGSLRGLLTHLNTDLVPLEQRLEGRVLSAMAYLKQCQYDDVKREVELFQNEMRPLAKQLDQNKKATKTKELASEAILKMRFVKLELLSQIQWLEKVKANPQVLAKNNQVAEAGTDTTKQLLARSGKRQMVFPVGKDIWVDELFNVRALSNTECDALYRERSK
jgi:hypothetical protein